MTGLVGLIGALCASCSLEDVAAVRQRLLAPPEAFVNQQLTDGCTRFALRVANGVALMETLYNTNGCQSDALRLESDTSPVFDAATGIFRVPVVLRNIGTVPVIAPARVRFMADSSQFLNGQGQVIPGTPNILATNYDTANANGRSGQWRYDAVLAGGGEPQVLMPNAASQRKWLEFSGSDWSQTIRIKLPTMATVAPAVPAVPAVAPDTLPAGFSDNANVVLNAGGGLPYVRHHIAVYFAPGTTQPQRQAAIALVNGVVVGGVRFANGDGFYVVRLASDSTPTTIDAAITTLSARSEVRHASRYHTLSAGPTYRRPNDGTGFAAADWSVMDSAGWAPSALSPRWALEAIQAPMAWGCSVGDSAVRVAVLDHVFSLVGVSDLSANVGLTTITDVPGDPIDHGTWVASVIGARGGNGIGIAGTAWRSTLELRDVIHRDSALRPVRDSLGRVRTMDLYSFLREFQQSLANGSRIINLSLGADSIALQQRTPEGYRDAATLNSQFITALQTALPIGQQPDPLLVVSAGNVPSGDGFESTFPVLRDSLDERVIVVAAARRDGQLRTSASNSPLIDVAAPGEAVSILTRGSNVPAVGSGASFAAPLVSGVAALLLSFDPTLSAAQLKQLIIGGAVRGGRSAGGYPVLNARESLRLAAERQSTPLCGNRLWIANRQVHIERGSLVETIPITLPTDQVWGLEAAHGGKRIDYETPAGQSALVWTLTGWIAGPSSPLAPGDRGGTGRSVRLESHDGDSLLSVLVGQSTSSVDVSLTLYGDAGLTPLRSTMITLPGLAPPPAATWEENEYVYVSGAYPMNGRDALVAVNRVRATNTAWITSCPEGASVSCQPGAVFYRYHWLPKQVDVYTVRIDASPLTAVHIATIPDTLIYDVAFSEDGREKLLRMGRDSIYEDPHLGHYAAVPFLCRATWSKPTFGSTSTTAPFDSTNARLRKDVFGCESERYRWERRGLGTSAPRVAPTGSTAPRSP